MIEEINELINLSSNESSIISIKNIISYFNDKKIEYDFEYLTLLLKKSNKLNSLVYFACNNETIYNKISPIDDLILIYEIENGIENNIINSNISDNDIETLTLYLNELPPTLSQSQEEVLAKKIHSDYTARKIFIESNLKLVVFIAKRYINSNISLEDLIQEGNIGLIKAVDKFDYTKGVRFSTYAVPWIKSYINRVINSKSRNIKLPILISKQVKVLNYIIGKLTIDYGREPTIEELSYSMNLTESEVIKLLSYTKYTLSLNDKNYDSLNELENNIIDEKASNFTNEIIKNMTEIEFRQEVLTCKELSYEYKFILALRYGFYDGEYRTLQEVADIFGVSRSNISFKEGNALKRLRNMSKIQEYK